MACIAGGPDKVKDNHEWWRASYRARVVRTRTGGIEITATRIKHQLEASMNRRAKGEGVSRSDSVAVATRRARRMIRWLIGENRLDHLLTLTYRANVQDLGRVKTDWKRFVRFVRVRYPDWGFVAVPELQERGAWHLHVAVQGRQDLNWLRKCWYRALGSKVWVTGSDTPGQINVRSPWKRWGGKGSKWDAAKLAGYLGKYIAKSFEDNAALNARRYWPAKEMRSPEITRFYLDAVDTVGMIEEVAIIVRRLNGVGWSMFLSPDSNAFWICASGAPPETCPF